MLVCRKCSKRAGGGFGEDGRERLAKALRRELGLAGKGKRARKDRLGVVEVGCLKICPKRAVMAIRCGDPGRWLAVPCGAAMDEVAAMLGLNTQERAGET